MRHHVGKVANGLVPESDHDAFVEDVMEDLELMDETRLAGLGVTPEQLKKWRC